MHIINRQFVRAPFYPFDKIQYINSKDRLLKFYKNNPSFEKAVYIASPGFYRQLECALQKNKVSNKLAITLLKYLLRSASKCTPFGLFSGFAITKFSENDSPIIFNDSHHIEIQRLSNVTLHKFFSLNQPQTKNVNFKLNETLFEIGNHAIYYELIDTSDFNSDFIKSNIEINEVLEHLIRSVKNYTSFQE